MSQNIELKVNQQLREKFEKMKKGIEAESDNELINVAISLVEVALDGKEEGKFIALIDAEKKSFEKVHLSGLAK
ncbi:TPA: hypothetical protein ACPVZG_004218 [Vibrio parahaemolyticus]